MEAKFSPKVKEVIGYSREEALRLNHDFIGIEHLMLGLIRDGNGIAIKALVALGVDPVQLRNELENSIQEKSAKGIFNPNSIPLTKQAERILKITVLEAKMMKSSLIGTEHLLLSILKNKDNIVSALLLKKYVDHTNVKDEVENIIANSTEADFQQPKMETPNDPNEEEFD
ncbi:MAG TPA: Clp protease N-terminal domain-containing protein, partial [Chitinophagales bacterium]|nr:Clp protease N-terminal domain-containing protein [Chitinophagales bacterium]